MRAIIPGGSTGSLAVSPVIVWPLLTVSRLVPSRSISESSPTCDDDARPGHDCAHPIATPRADSAARRRRVRRPTLATLARSAGRSRLRVFVLWAVEGSAAHRAVSSARRRRTRHTDGSRSRPLHCPGDRHRPRRQRLRPATTGWRTRDQRALPAALVPRRARARRGCRRTDQAARVVDCHRADLVLAEALREQPVREVGQSVLDGRCGLLAQVAGEE